MNATAVKPQVGVTVFIWHNNKFLMYRRHGSHAAGSWALPGGHLEFGETFEGCAKREVMEEFGITIENVRFIAVTNDVLEQEQKHYVSIWLEADLLAGEPRIMEPEKASDLQWHTFQDLPSPLFEPSWNNLRKIRPELFAEQSAKH